MDYTAFKCPHCRTHNQCILSTKYEKHLRQCSGCERWFVVTRDQVGSKIEHHIDSLEEPPTCPVDGCEQTVSVDSLPPHIIESHEGELTGTVEPQR